MFICFFYSPTGLDHASPYDPDRPIALLPLMNIAEKYQVEFLRPQIVARIEADWPDTVEKWDATRGSESECEYEPVAALNFATRFGIRKILPAAMYALACTPYSRERSAESVPLSEAPDTSTGAGGVPEMLGGQEIENGTPTRCRARRSARWAMLSSAHQGRSLSKSGVVHPRWMIRIFSKEGRS